MDLSIVVPVYNSCQILEKFVGAIKESITFTDSFELILVNDCSPDSSWEKIEELALDYSFVKGVNLMKNYSQHNAIMAGFNEASGEVVVTMDDDLQHSPKDVKKLYDTLKNSDFDVCYTRFENKEHQAWKVLGSKFNDLVANSLINKPRELYLSPFRAISRKVKDEIVKYDGPYPYIDGLILSVTNKVTYIAVKHHERLEGEGNYTFFKSISLWTKMATGFSISPLRFATYFGCVISFFAFLLLLLFVIQKFTVNLMPDGWTSIVVLILFFGGVQLISIGIIGEYIGRIYLSINKKSQFIVREKLDDSNDISK